MKVAVFQVIVLLLVAGPASAQTGTGDNSDVNLAPVPPADDDKKDKKDEKDKKDKDDDGEPDETYDFGGRLFVRNTLTKFPDNASIFPGVWNNDLLVDSARVNFNFRDARRGIRIQVEAEFADRADLKDAYFRLDLSESLRVKTGRFKRPLSAVALESKWDLPVIERGVISDLEEPTSRGSTDSLPVGGRSEGVQLEYTGRDLPLEPRLYLGVFRGDVHDIKAALTDVSEDGFTEDIYARVELEPKSDVRVGLSGAWVAQISSLGGATGADDIHRRSFIGNVDVSAEVGPLRVWLEGFAGKNPMHIDFPLLQVGPRAQAWGSYFAFRGVLALRFSRPVEGTRWIEPWVSGQFADVSSKEDSTNTDDGMWAVSGGLNAFFKKSYRLQLGVEHTDVGRAFVAGGSTKYVAQLAAVF